MSLLRLKEQCQDLPGGLVAGARVQSLVRVLELAQPKKKKKKQCILFRVRVRKRQGPTFKDHEIYIDLPQIEKNLKLQIFDVSRELCSGLRGSLDGSGLWGRRDTGICMAESLCCLPETITRLLIGYTPIQHKKFKKENKNQICDVTGFIFSSGFDPWVRKILWRRQ